MKKLLKGGIIGVIVGAVGGVLFAPKSGKETRKDIKNASKKATSEAEKKLKALHKELQDVEKEGAKKLKSLKGKAESDLKELLSRGEVAKDKIGEAISVLREGNGENVDVEKVEKDGKSIKDKIAKKIAPKKKA